MMAERIQEFAAENGYTKIEKAEPWHGYDVYVPVYDEMSYVGLPFVILVRGEEIRLSTPEEALEWVRTQPE